jgi:methylmalonyl-CoA/ethylmalonyl-CoA epimerase
MHIDHICIAVRSIPATKKRLCNILQYQEKTKMVKNTKQDVLVQFFSKEDSLDIKLIQPAGPDSPLKNFLKSRGEGLHHICFKADDVNQAINNLQEQGARITADPLPGEAFDNELIAFAYVAGGLNIEIIDTDKRRDLI